MKKSLTIFCFFLLSTSLVLCGCGITSFVLHPFGQKESSLKKRVLVTSLTDQAGFGKQVDLDLKNMLIKKLSATKKAVLFNAGANVSGSESASGISYGVVVDKGLLQWARKKEINAILMGTISPIERQVKLKGIWPLRSAVAYYQVALVVNLVNPQSGTVIMSHVESGGVSIELEDEEFMEKKWVKEELQRTILPRLIKNSIEPIKEALDSEPWEGRILSVDHRIEINAGSDVGVKTGQEFEVYGGSDMVHTKDGRELLVSWQKIGRIRVTEVGKTASLAVPVKGEGFREGQRIVSID